VRPSTTFGHGAAAVEDDESLDRVPRNRGGRVLLLVGAAALGGTFLAAGVTRGDAARALAFATRTARSFAAAPSLALAPVVPAAHAEPSAEQDGGPSPAVDGGVAPSVAPALGTTLETRFQELR
jgi:hypothetical protein